MKGIGIILTSPILLALLVGDTWAMDSRMFLSVRGGWAESTDGSSFASSPASFVAGTWRPLRRVAPIASIGYHPSARTAFGGGACFFHGGCPHAHQKFGVASVGVGARYRLGDASVSPYLPTLEIIPTLFYGEWEDQQAQSGAEIQVPGMSRVFAGLQSNLVMPLRLTSHASLDLGVGYIYSEGIDREDGSHRAGLRHFMGFAGVTYGR